MNECRIYDVIIVGGGAAGLFAAVCCVQAGVSVAICERQSRVGRKLLSTGAGTCNISNKTVSPQNYHSISGDAVTFVAPALTMFSPKAILDCFESIGIVTQADRRGRVYPLCKSAAAVLDCLRLAYANKADELTEFDVLSIVPSDDGYAVTAADGRCVCGRHIIIACGGAASSSLGGCDCTRLLHEVNGRMTESFPSVVPLYTDTTFIRAIKGLRVQGQISIFKGEKQLDVANDEIQFIDSGISGPAALSVSRCVSLWEQSGKRGRMTARVNFLPDFDAYDMIQRRIVLDRPLEELLTGLFQKRIGQTLLRYSGVTTAGRKCAELTDIEIRKIAAAIESFSVEVTGTAGLRNAQVTAGGLKLSNVNNVTMMLKSMKNIYVVGEALDIDGDCGGYNLQWAWSSAATAVQSICG